jgi:hypothetical protein
MWPKQLLVAISSSVFFFLLAFPTMGADLSEPFGLVQKTVIIISPSTSPTALQNAAHTYTEQGMILTALSCCASDPTFSSVTDSSSPLYVGENTLFHHIDGGLIMLARVDEGTFNMLSIDAAQLPGFDQFGNPVLYGPFPITFTGIKKNGKTVTTVFTAHNFPQVDTFTFNGFNELVAVQWFNGGAPGIPDHQFAKIIVQVKKPLLP